MAKPMPAEPPDKHRRYALSWDLHAAVHVRHSLAKKHRQTCYKDALVFQVLIHANHAHAATRNVTEGCWVRNPRHKQGELLLKTCKQEPKFPKNRLVTRLLVMARASWLQGLVDIIFKCEICSQKFCTQKRSHGPVRAAQQGAHVH